MRRRELLLGLLGAPQGAASLVVRVADGKVLRLDHPEAVRGRALAPGSAVKPIVLPALANARTAVCRGQLRLGDRVLDCTHVPQIGPIDAETALAASCNSWFAQMASRSDPALLQRTLLRAGAEARLARDAEELQLQALGLEAVRFTPMALAEAYRRIALSGDLTVRRALARSAREGTSRLASPARFEVAGKTGTAPGAAWFAGYAPILDPRVVVVVQLPYGRGGSDAAPLAREIFEWWRNSSSR